MTNYKKLLKQAIARLTKSLFLMQVKQGPQAGTLRPSVFSWPTLAAYVPLRGEGSESVPAMVC